MNAEELMTRLIAKLRLELTAASNELTAARRDAGATMSVQLTPDELRHLAFLVGNHLALEPCKACSSVHAQLRASQGVRS